jgi:Uma2 family endonuclease
LTIPQPAHSSGALIMAATGSPASGQSLTAEPLPDVRPCLDDVVTEDDSPVDNMFSEKQQRLLTEPLYSSWDAGQPFLAAGNVGVFYAVRQPPLVPDAFVSLDVEVPGDWLAKEHRSYFIWEFGKPPEAVVEIVSNAVGGETTDKMHKYAQMGIIYYAIYDPGHEVQTEPLRVFVLREKSYVPCAAEWLPVLGLGLKLWQGSFENWDTVWLRWCDRQGRVIPTGAERAENERQRAEQADRRAEQADRRAEQADQRAEQADQRAEQERLRADRLAAQLRDLGVSPTEP